ncbi:P-loop containing nucleoside triphosphate hydrolase [Glarea lozoyensis ATCC 20868]|uniref:p-loop containing nucleoside triphosphate hydrolase n=1 Tax=Glarea lozoyensis (strain ATCC 20868 / MF5171) TaxID=1116229 RepID=S3CTF5_GLAL2|nr:P-loop containing nucleoside triphosphate hydrolase [Glarea lozoyensis ATCC 20868]EPE28299.1 P-loop containing nucleoside triphosphate hydrolase [Glarea lozoyensis ATCC 20868]
MFDNIEELRSEDNYQKHEATLKTIRNEIEKLRSDLDDLKHKATAESISSLDLSVTQNVFSVETVENNALWRWLFENKQFKSWKVPHQSASPRFFGLSGAPGAGKTFLATTVVRHFQTQETSQAVGVAFVHFDYRDRKSQTFENVMKRLIQQLTKSLERDSGDSSLLHMKNESARSRPQVEHFLEILNVVTESFSDVRIVIDALDECDQTMRKIFVKMLQSLPAKYRIFCTSRYLGEVDEIYSEWSWLDVSATKEYVRSYVELQVKSSPRLQNYFHAARDLEGIICDQVTKNSQGLLALANSSVCFLEATTSVKSLRKAIIVLPTHIKELYDHTMTRIRKQPANQSRLAITILSWLTLATKTLTVGVINNAIAAMDLEIGDTSLDKDSFVDEAEMINVCCGLVRIDQETKVIRFAHGTIERFFYDEWQRTIPNAAKDILNARDNILLCDSTVDRAKAELMDCIPSDPVPSEDSK